MRRGGARICFSTCILKEWAAARRAVIRSVRRGRINEIKGREMCIRDSNFTDLGPLQSAHVLQYALTTDPGCAFRYGVSVTVLQAGGRDTQSCRAICDTQEGICRLLVFLWENAVEPCAVRGIVEDIRRAGLLPCGAEE